MNIQRLINNRKAKHNHTKCIKPMWMRKCYWLDRSKSNYSLYIIIKSPFGSLLKGLF